MIKKIKVDTILFDFDSTLLRGELLEILADIQLKNHPLKATIMNQIKEVTNLGMEGKIAFSESLDRRLRLLNLTLQTMDSSLSIIKDKINGEYIYAYPKFMNKNIHIISGGYKNIIDQLSDDLFIAKDNIHAINLFFNGNNFSHFDRQHPLVEDNGKAKVAKSIRNKGTTVMIGDGVTDYLVKENGGADYFIAYTGIVKRTAVCDKADMILENMNDIANLIEL